MQPVDVVGPVGEGGHQLPLRQPPLDVEVVLQQGGGQLPGALPAREVKVGAAIWEKARRIKRDLVTGGSPYWPSNPRQSLCTHLAPVSRMASTPGSSLTERQSQAPLCST